MDNRYDDIIDNENFYKIMNPYIESGILTEIYASYYISVFNVANKIYVTCPHMAVDGSVVGHMSTEPIIYQEIIDNSYAFEMQVKTTRIMPKGCFIFDKKHDDFWRNYRTRTKTSKSYTDSKFDEEIMRKYPKESANEMVQAQQHSYIPPKPLYTYPVRGINPTVLYIIAGVMAALQVLLFFLPHLSYRGKVFLPVEMFGGAGALEKVGIRDDSFGLEGEFMVYFAIVVALEIVWAVLSFLRKKPAGIFGIVACVIGFFIHMVWLFAMFYLTSSISDSITPVIITPLPIFMFLISIAGIPVSIMQIAKKNYLL